MVTTTLSNSGGTLVMHNIIDWHEGQVFDVAIREVAKRTAGAVVDDSTYTITLKTITIKTRLALGEKMTLQALIDVADLATLVAGNWAYTVWIKSRQPKYKHIIDDDDILRPWETSITMLASQGGLCPIGERLTNRGFETGDLTGWTEDGTSSVTNTQHRSGLYSARVVADLCSGIGGWIQQNISIGVGCITELSFWAKYRSWSSMVRMTVHYDDGTEDSHIFAINSSEWTKCDMKVYLSFGKVIEYIRITAVGVAYTYIDDVSLVGAA